jgi:Domain of unknown function (DUF4276)
VVKLFVEGGGDSKLLRKECRNAFSEFLSKAGCAGKMPRIVACGDRRSAYEDFCTAVANGEEALLLVDSEFAVADAHQAGASHDWLPWHHLAQRAGDGWQRPLTATESQCHLMVECMEAWLIADRASLGDFYGQGFRENALPKVATGIETVSKATLYTALADATKDCKPKGAYGKGAHSFKLLAALDPQKVVAASLWAKRFVDETAQQLHA